MDVIAWETLQKVRGRLCLNPQSGLGLGKESPLHFTAAGAALLNFLLIEVYKEVSRYFVREQFLTA